MQLHFPPISRFLERFRSVLRRRRRFSFEEELRGLSRAEQASAFLALLELRRLDELRIEQPAPFEPIGVLRLDVERSLA
jgi:chromatin segregation and condensation protein Rec8/ScpA/Scc1 (kleisin family)